MDRGASINAMIMKVIRNLQPGSPIEKAGVISLSDNDFETLVQETFQIKLLLKGKTLPAGFILRMEKGNGSILASSMSPGLGTWI